MKIKTILIAALALLCCTDGTARSRKKKATVKETPAAIQPVPADSFSYAFGLAQSESLRQYLTTREGVDTAYLAYAVRGLSANISEQEEKQALAYAAGLRIAKMNRDQVIPSINKQATGKSDTTYTILSEMNRGLADGLLGKSGALTPDSAMKIAERQINFYKSVYRQANLDYLAANKKKKGVQTTKSGLQYTILSKGTGALPTDTSEVEVHYEGRLIDGTVFDSSYQRKSPASFRCDQVIKGWTEALGMMPVGSLWEIVIPAELGYGERDMQKIPANSTLIFKVELLGIKK